jgi:signal transduction histidine kinase
MDVINMMIGAMATQFILLAFYFFIFKKIEFLNLLFCGLSMMFFVFLVIFPTLEQEWQRYVPKLTIEIRNIFVFGAIGFYYEFVRGFLGEKEKHVLFNRILKVSSTTLFITVGLYIIRNLMGKAADWTVGYFYAVYFINYVVQFYVVVYLLWIRQTRVRFIAFGTLFIFVIVKVALIPNFQSDQLDANLLSISNVMLFGLTINFLFFTFSLIHGMWERSREMALLELNRAVELNNQRVEIGNDLHDDLGATLSSLHIYSSIAQKFVEDDPAKTKANLDLISSNVFTLMEKINDVIWSVSSKQSNVSLLSTRIKDCFVNIFDAAGIKCTYDIDESIEMSITGLKARKLLLLFAKEAINNAIKHSGADAIRFAIQKSNDQLLMSIEDNGVGIGSPDFAKGNGLSNLKHRVDQLNGNFSIETLRPHGTLVECIIPLTNISL